MSLDEQIDRMASQAQAEIRQLFARARKEQEARFSSIRRSKGQLFRKRK